MNAADRIRNGSAVLVALGAMLAGAVPASAALVGYWPMNEASWNGTPDEVIDVSGSGNHGTGQGAATTDSGGRFDRAGRFNGLFQPDGVKVNSDPSLALGSNGTVSIWARFDNLYDHPTNPTATETHNLFRGDSYYTSFLLNQYGNRFLVYWTSSGGPQVSVPASTFAFDTSDWHHLLVTNDGGALTAYADGDIVGTGTEYTNSFVQQNIWFGGQGNRPVNGMVDDAAIWNDAISVGQARSIYNVPTDLGLDYDLGDIMGLWGVYDMGPGASINIDGIGWSYAASLPGSTALGDAYEYAGDGKLYVVLGSGTGLVGVPEPSTLAMLLGLGGVGLLGWMKRRRRN